MILILRGHIRNSFNNLELFNLIKQIYEFDDTLTIYIHTWNVISSNISWRKIENNNFKVTPELIYQYFGEFKYLIKHIIIDNDNQIKLIGNLNGNVGQTKMPLIGWKNYWYGIYTIISYLKNLSPDENIINCRFDIINNSNSRAITEIMKFIKAYKDIKLTKNVFINSNPIGIDNIYIGNINTMNILAYNFHYFLDNILIKNPIFNHQEALVYKVNYRLFTI